MKEIVWCCLRPWSGNLSNGLVGYWPFNGNANDESGNGNDGTVNGATLTTDRFGNSNSAYEFTVGNVINLPEINNLIGTPDLIRVIQCGSKGNLSVVVLQVKY